MLKRKIHGHPVLIIGAGRGGCALLEMFLEIDLVEVIAIADPNPDAPGALLAAKHGIPSFLDAADALLACKDHPDCIVYNLTHDDAIAAQVNTIFSNKNVTSGIEAKLIWQMVTNLKRIKNEFEASQSQLQAVINNVMDGIISMSESGIIQGFNPAAETIFGYSQQEILGQNIKKLMPESVQCELDNYLKQHTRTDRMQIMNGGAREFVAVRKNGEQFPMELSASEMVLGGERYFVGIVRDITERKQAEQKITHMAHHDFLTGLPNRALFVERLAQAVAMASRSNYKEAVLFLDLDGFKRVNDTLGHEAGDLLLQEVATRLKKVVRSSDTVARVGGDEFTFVLNNVSADVHAEAAAKKIIATLSEPFNLLGQQCNIGGSIGIAMFPDDAQDFESLLRLADEAMYLAKRNGKNTYKFYRDVQHAAKLQHAKVIDVDFDMAILNGSPIQLAV